MIRWKHVTPYSVNYNVMFWYFHTKIPVTSQKGFTMNQRNKAIWWILKELPVLETNIDILNCSKKGIFFRVHTSHQGTFKGNFFPFYHSSVDQRLLLKTLSAAVLNRNSNLYMTKTCKHRGPLLVLYKVYKVHQLYLAMSIGKLLHVEIKIFEQVSDSLHVVWVRNIPRIVLR